MATSNMILSQRQSTATEIVFHTQVCIVDKETAEKSELSWWISQVLLVQQVVASGSQ